MLKKCSTHIIRFKNKLMLHYLQGICCQLHWLLFFWHLILLNILTLQMFSPEWFKYFKSFVWFSHVTLYFDFLQLVLIRRGHVIPNRQNYDCVLKQLLPFENIKFMSKIMKHLNLVLKVRHSSKFNNTCICCLKKAKVRCLCDIY